MNFNEFYTFLINYYSFLQSSQHSGSQRRQYTEQENEQFIFEIASLYQQKYNVKVINDETGRVNKQFRTARGLCQEQDKKHLQDLASKFFRDYFKNVIYQKLKNDRNYDYDLLLEEIRLQAGTYFCPKKFEQFLQQLKRQKQSILDTGEYRARMLAEQGVRNDDIDFQNYDGRQIFSPTSKEQYDRLPMSPIQKQQLELLVNKLKSIDDTEILEQKPQSQVEFQQQTQ